MLSMSYCNIYIHTNLVPTPYKKIALMKNSAGNFNYTTRTSCFSAIQTMHDGNLKKNASYSESSCFFLMLPSIQKHTIRYYYYDTAILKTLLSKLIITLIRTELLESTYWLIRKLAL